MLQPDTADCEKQLASLFSHVLLSFSSLFLQLPHLNSQITVARQVPCLKLFMLLFFFVLAWKRVGLPVKSGREAAVPLKWVEGLLRFHKTVLLCCFWEKYICFSPLVTVVEPWINKQELSLYELCLKWFLMLFGPEMFLIKIWHNTMYCQVQTCLMLAVYEWGD